MANHVKSGVTFKTRYTLTPIDSTTGKQSGESITVCNMVLDSGLTALGLATAYTSIGLGTSGLAPDSTQTSLLKLVDSVDISAMTSKHTTAPVAGGVKSIITHQLVFKNIQFPSNERYVTLNEIGINGVTRAVFPEPLTIGLKDWVDVTVSVEYTYADAPDSHVDLIVNGTTETTIGYDVTFTPLTESPNNLSGRGWGGSTTVQCKVWDGVVKSGNLGTATISGLSIAQQISNVDNAWVFSVTGSYTAINAVKGFVIADTLNSVQGLLKFSEILDFEEDDKITLTITFNWSR